MNKAFIGFTLRDSYKLFEVNEHEDLHPNVLGNDFVYFMSRIALYFTNEDAKYDFYRSIAIVNSDKDNYKHVIRHANENDEKIKEGNFSVFRPPRRAGRGFRFVMTYLYNETEKIFNNLNDYKWGYLFNINYERVEFYGTDFPRKGLLNGVLNFPYYASINPKSLTAFYGFASRADIVDVLKRSHEQELILQESEKKEKPFKHKPERKRKISRRSFL